MIEAIGPDAGDGLCENGTFFRLGEAESLAIRADHCEPGAPDRSRLHLPHAMADWPDLPVWLEGRA